MNDDDQPTSETASVHHEDLPNRGTVIHGLKDMLAYRCVDDIIHPSGAAKQDVEVLRAAILLLEL